MRPLAVAVTLLAAPLAAQDDAPPRPPNVVLVLIDDAGLEAFPGWGGSDAIATPHLEALAASGMRFTRAHAYPLCTPSRVALMTGRDGIRNYVNFSILDRSERTFANQLQAAGYATAVVGKWQLLGAAHYGEWAGKGSTPQQAGFDRWLLWQVEQLGSRYWQPTLDRDGTLEEHGAGAHGPDLFAAAYAIERIEQWAEARRPFLLYYPMALTHDPFARTPDGDAPRGPAGRQARFHDMVEHADALLGRLLAALERTGARDNTLVLVTSDNGSHRSLRTPAVGGGEVAGGKGNTTARGTRVPLVASWPGHIAAGSQCDHLLDFTDVLPTLCEITGAPLPDVPLDGRSFAATLRGGSEPHREVSVVYYNPRPYRPEQHPERQWALGPRFKLYRDGRLFDVERDPDETAPLAADELDDEGRAQVAMLRDALAATPEWPARIPRAVVERGR